MITSVNKQNAAAYRKLFARASKKFNFEWDLETEKQLAHMDDEEFLAWWNEQRASSSNKLIASLDDYFQNIVELATTETEGDNWDPMQYTVLPLDEPAFDIDANTRKITVPAPFKANGVSAKGEHGAEVVYFRIDRYFEAMDFGATDMHIIIQWQTPASAENPGGSYGASPAIIIDRESQPGKVIFGWLLDNRITEAPGKIQFSVRIYKTGLNAGNDVVETYNFTTQVAEAEILNAQDYDLGEVTAPDEMVDALALIKSRLTNSPASTNTVEAAQPRFVLNLINTKLDGTETDLEGSYYWKDGEAYGVKADGSRGLYTAADPAEAGAGQKLTVNVSVEDAGPENALQYIWYYWTLGQNPAVDSGELKADGFVEYNPVYVHDPASEEDIAFAADKDYYLGYKKLGAGAYELLTSADYEVGQSMYDWATAKAAGDGEFEEIAIYELNANLIAGRTGYYKVLAVNHVGKNKNEKLSDMIYVPGPGSLSIAPSTDDYDVDAEYVGANYQPVNVLNDGKAHVFFADDSDFALPKVAATTKAGNAVSYVWSVIGEEGEAVLETIAPTVDKLEAEFAVEAPATDAERALFDKTYVVKVDALRNKDSISEDVDGIKTFKVRVTDKARVLPFYGAKTTLGQEEAFSADYGVGDELTLNIGETAVSDEKAYHWYQYTKDKDGDVLLPRLPENDEDTGCTDASFTPDGSGNFYCEVTNRIKDGDAVVSEVSFLSPIFVVA